MFYADLHIHSRYSRATSRDCDLPHLDLWARKKGIALVGSGDFTHPAWRAELADKLGDLPMKQLIQLPPLVEEARQGLERNGNTALLVTDFCLRLRETAGR